MKKEKLERIWSKYILGSRPVMNTLCGMYLFTLRCTLNMLYNYMTSSDWLLIIFLLFLNYSKFSKNVKPEFNRRGMPGSKKLIFNAFLVYFWLNHVAGEEMNDAASDELLSVRSLRNWVSKTVYFSNKKYWIWLMI